MGVETAFGVRIDIEFDLADTAIELLRKRLMLVVQTFVSVCIFFLPDLAFVGCYAGVVAVVRADDLNLVELESTVGCLGVKINAESCSQSNYGEHAEVDGEQSVSFGLTTL